MKFHKIAYIVMTILTVIILCLTFYSTVTHKTDVFYTVPNILLFSVFFIVQVICIAMYKPKFTVYKIGFYVLHFGLLLMLVGFLAYYISGESLNINVPVDKNVGYNKIEKVEDDGTSTIIDIGFYLTVEDFKIIYYEKEENEEKAQPKQYIANLRLSDPVSLQAKRSEIKVNSPIKHKGWKIYLMSHSQNEDYVTLLLKKDPAEGVALTGIYMTMIGGVLMCLVRRKKAGEES